MAAVVRVKRRLTDESPQALVVASKRRKLTGGGDSEDNAEEVANVFSYVGTVKSEGENIGTCIEKAIKERQRAGCKKHVVDFSVWLRKQATELSRRNRFKVISQRRDLDIDVEKKSLEEVAEESASEPKRTLFHLYDAVYDADVDESQPKEKKGKSAENAVLREPGAITCNGVQMQKEVDAFVYDLYCCVVEDAEGFGGDSVSIHKFEDDLVHEDYREPEPMDDEDDSNDEGNWRNEYPDTDEGSSESNLGLKLHNRDSMDEWENDSEDERLGDLLLHCNLGQRRGEAQHDDDEEEEGMAGEVGSIKEENVRLHGLAYARFKAKIERQFHTDEDDEKDEEESD